MEIGTGNQPTFSHLQVKYKMDRFFSVCGKLHTPATEHIMCCYSGCVHTVVINISFDYLHKIQCDQMIWSPTSTLFAHLHWKSHSIWKIMRTVENRVKRVATVLTWSSASLTYHINPVFCIILKANYVVSDRIQTLAPFSTSYNGFAVKRRVFHGWKGV